MRLDRLVNKDGEVLRHGMAKSLSRILLCQNCGHSQCAQQFLAAIDKQCLCAARMRRYSFLMLPFDPIGPKPFTPDDALIEVCKTSVALGIHGLREIVLPTHAIGDCQLAAHPELVLGIQEKALLTFSRILANAGETLEFGNITE